MLICHHPLLTWAAHKVWVRLGLPRSDKDNQVNRSSGQYISLTYQILLQYLASSLTLYLLNQKIAEKIVSKLLLPCFLFTMNKTHVSRQIIFDTGCKYFIKLSTWWTNKAKQLTVGSHMCVWTPCLVPARTVPRLPTTGGVSHRHIEYFIVLKFHFLFINLLIFLPWSEVHHVYLLVLSDRRPCWLSQWGVVPTIEGVGRGLRWYLINARYDLICKLYPGWRLNNYQW